VSQADREKWDARWRARDYESVEPSAWLTSLGDLLPTRGPALDVAGGAGRNSIWLARRGLDVVCVDVSEVGLSLAQAAAEAAGVRIETVRADLDGDPLPAGPFDVVLSFHFLRRELFAAFPGVLASGGLLVYAQPTKRNLERHARPPAGFLIEEGELPSLVVGIGGLGGLEIVRYEEGWLDEGRHEARMVARKPSG